MPPSKNTPTPIKSIEVSFQINAHHYEPKHSTQTVIPTRPSKEPLTYAVPASQRSIDNLQKEAMDTMKETTARYDEAFMAMTHLMIDNELHIEGLINVYIQFINPTITHVKTLADMVAEKHLSHETLSLDKTLSTLMHGLATLYATKDIQDINCLTDAIENGVPKSQARSHS
jgi:Holliday junction resolvase RusA-like endonuclease